MFSSSASDSFVEYEYKINDNIKLRPLTINDAAASFRLINENREYLGKFLPWVDFIKKLDDEIAYITDSILHIKEGKKLELGIFLKVITENKENWKMIGTCGFVSIKDRCGTIGYWLDERHTRKGVVTSACTCLIEKTAKEIGLSRIIAHVSPKNINSRRVLERLGFTTDNVMLNIDLYGTPKYMLLYVCPNDLFDSNK